MSKWFESANLASYAKTALLQAQKRIDQVLDIKEDEILANNLTKPAANLDTDPTSLTSPSIVFNKHQNQSTNLPASSTEGDFFSSFLNQINHTNNTSNSNTRSNSPSHASHTSNVVANLDDFNSSNRKITKSKTSLSSASVTNHEQINFDSFVNSKEQQQDVIVQSQTDADHIFNLKSVSASSLGANDLLPLPAPPPKPAKLGRTTSSSSSSHAKTNKQQQQSQQNSQIELEKIEKKNWIQNYVDSDGCNVFVDGGSSLNFVPPITQSPSPPLPSPLPLPQQTIVEDDSNKTVINEATEQYQHILTISSKSCSS